MSGSAAMDETGAPDAFALLGLPRRAWLDPDAVSASFRERATKLHPDTEGGDAEAFRLLAEAARVLSITPVRLRLLAGASHACGPSVVPSDLAGLFGGAAEAMRRADEWKIRHGSARSALSKALARRDAMEIDETLEKAGAALEARAAALDDECRALDEASAEGAMDAVRVAALAHRAAFLWKWRDRIQRARLALVMA